MSLDFLAPACVRARAYTRIKVKIYPDIPET